LSPEIDDNDLKYSRYAKRVRELKRRGYLNRGDIWLANFSMPVEFQSKAQVYRAMSKQFPKGLWYIGQIMDRPKRKLVCDWCEKRAMVASYQYFHILCEAHAENYAEHLGERLIFRPGQ
jgi:hypothetical protein